MNRKVFFLLILPLAWLVAAMIAIPFHPDKFYIVALAPSAWLALFGGFFSHTTFEMLAAGLPTMTLVGLILISLRMTPRAAIISSLVLALVLWGSFLIVVWESRAIRAYGAPFAWFLCCFDLALCLLPILALLGIVGRLRIKAFKKPKTDSGNEMNKKIFLITAIFVTVLLFVLYCVNCMLDESPYEALFGKITGPVCMLGWPVGRLVFLVFGETTTSIGDGFLFLISIAVGSGILWGFIVERVVHIFGTKRQIIRIDKQVASAYHSPGSLSLSRILSMQFMKPRICPIIIILLVICLVVSSLYQQYRIVHLRRIVDHLSSVNLSFSKWMNGEDAYKFVQFINKAGYYPIKVEGRRNNKINEFRFVIKNHPKGPWWWYWYYGITPQMYERFKQKHLKEGCEEIYHQSFDGVDGFETHQCVFLKLTPAKSARATAASATNVAAEVTPRIIATAPAAGAADIDPATSEIVVTFDCEMAHGFSWTGGGPDYPPKAEGQAPHWRDTRTAVLPVKLEPGHYYRVGINSESYRNFRSAAGVPALPSAIYFTTRGADSNMTAKIRKPTILEIQPANGADAVDPKTTELRVTFTVPMGGGYSWTGSGSDYPSMPEGERPHWTNDHRTCVLPVRLEPNHQYRIGLNSSSHQNFQSAAGVPLDPVIYTFRTGQ